MQLLTGNRDWLSMMMRSSFLFCWREFVTRAVFLKHGLQPSKGTDYKSGVFGKDKIKKNTGILTILS
jgi:hypothetical protein